jgi:hypothetical protein
MAYLKVIDKQNPRKKVYPPSLKWRVAFFVTLVFNLIQLYYIFKN